MNRTRRIIHFNLILILFLSVLTLQAPASAKTGALWTATFSDPYFMGTSMTSTPIITGDRIYVANRDVLYELDKKTGKVLSELALPTRMNSVCDPALVGSRLYIPLSGGIITCVDIIAHQILWSSENMSVRYDKDFQTLGRLRYYDGYLYAGTWCRSETAPGSVSSDKDIASEGVFFCINAQDGQTVWTYKDNDNPVGFYWTECVKSHGRIFFTAEDGTLISHSPGTQTIEILSAAGGDMSGTHTARVSGNEPINGVYEERALTGGMQLRNGLCLSDDGNSIYTVSKAGALIEIALADDGSVKDVKTTALMPDASNVNCTSTPTFCDGTLYIGCAADGAGYLCVVDATTLKLRYAAKGQPYGEIKSRPLVIRETTYATCSGAAASLNVSDVNISSQADETRYIYFTANEKTGSLYRLIDTPAATSGNIETVFTPYSAKQYCLADVVTDEDGILYYSNDSGTLFAIGETEKSADEPDTVKVDKPYNIKIKPKRSAFVLTWKKKQKNARTEIFIKNNNKWKLYKDTAKTKLKINYNSINKLHINNNKLSIKLRCYIKQSDNKNYSNYSKKISVAWG